MTNEINASNTEKQLQLDKIKELNDKVRSLEDTVQQLQMEAQHQNELRILEQQKNEMQRQAQDVPKVCPNCLENYQKVELKEQELNEAYKKISQYEQQAQMK